ncbi:MAG: hypothetical protein US96_C0006G0004 [Candidatus Woesebacteria bacterium GW2011_GWB1_38_5b]|uniref:Glycosyltransferase RgtA/B/C/D-like domain-containing protein n=1 Tax=Candidatus Woesebacteria bacterium GW2011_GWB1_38_5b TaxID=1618569 RepID=A0A0G0KA46_9BACT|nr:MAG: hypothetical protein US96_C0006G0004 [Candidatus Woesebacteria bacterium GW2011_GWB1_38_5b]
MKKLTRFELSLIIIILGHALVLLKSVFLPYPELFVYPYLTNIGLTPYVQILDQHFPGLMFFPVNLANLGFTTPDSFRILQVGIITFIHVIIYKTIVNITGSKKSALAGNIIFFVLHPFLEGHVVWIDNLIPLLLLPAYYLLLNKNKKNILLSGIFIGAAILLKQVVVPLSVLLLIVLWIEDKTVIKYFLTGLLVPLSFLLLFVLNKNMLNDFIFWTYTFNVTSFADMGRKYATWRQVLAVSVLYAPAILIAFYGFIVKNRTLMLLAIFFLVSLLFAYARFDFVHLQPSLPFAVILLVYFLSRLPNRFYESAFILFLIPIVWIASRFFINAGSGGITFFGSEEYKVADRISEYVKRSDPIFMYGTLPHMYQLTNTRPSGNIFVFHFPWFMKIAQPRILEGLMNDPPKVVITQKSATIDGESLFGYMEDIDEYIVENYEKIDEVGDIEILIPKKL